MQDGTYAFIHGGDERPKYSPPLWHSIMFLEVEVDPSAGADLGEHQFPSQTPLPSGKGGSWTREWGMEKGT